MAAAQENAIERRRKEALDKFARLRGQTNDQKTLSKARIELDTTLQSLLDEEKKKKVGKAPPSVMDWLLAPRK
jgi:hypothetical protein